MTSIWKQLDVEAKVIDVLSSVQPTASPRLGGRPFVSVYQLAILIDGRYPEVRHALNDVPIGGADSGSRTSLAQYLAERLTAELHAHRNDSDYRIEGAALSRVHLGEVRFKVPGGPDIRNSNTEAGFDLSLFRLTDAPASTTRQ